MLSRKIGRGTCIEAFRVELRLFWVDCTWMKREPGAERVV